MAIHNSVVQFFSSEWAASHAREFYKAPNTEVTEFGANIDKASNPEEKNYTM